MRQGLSYHCGRNVVLSLTGCLIQERRWSELCGLEVKYRFSAKTKIYKVKGRIND
jgi:hypothetical protein